MRNPRENWLERYLGIQLAADRRVRRALEQAALDAERELLRIAGVEGVGAAARRSQLVTARRAMGRILNDLFQVILSVIQSGQKDAVSAAVDAAANDEWRFLQAIFPNAEDRESYINSLKQTAERNIQAMIVRVTGTERTLSRRVYHSKQLADGSISRTINSSLARGDSVAGLAKKVKDSIRPDTPGGVGYAAKRLARTEINNAYHAQSIIQNEEKPWVESVSWHLSKSHPNSPGDLCEVYARQGIFPKERVPAKPHPNCFCYTTPNLVDFETFQKNFIAGMYNGWLQDNDAA